MLTNLDNQEALEKIDTGKIVASIRLLPDQMEQAWEEVKEIELSSECLHAKNVVVCGMGGSALGGRIIDSLLLDRVRVPIEVFTTYDVPNYVGKDSFVFVSSYSGNTEEALSAAHQAVRRKAQVFGSTTGGRLGKYLKSEKVPSYIFDPKANPSKQPRMGLGYSIASTLGILSRCGFFHLADDEFYRLVVNARSFVKENDLDSSIDRNISKNIARKLADRAVILIASDHLVGVVHAFKNQLNESSKTFSALFDLPELNHHLLEGLQFPRKAKGSFHFLMFESDLYNKRIRLRYGLTKDIIEKNHHEVSMFQPRSEAKLSQIIETLITGSFVSFYLAVLNGVNPTDIPFVDYLKEQLAKA